MACVLTYAGDVPRHAYVPRHAETFEWYHRSCYQTISSTAIPPAGNALYCSVQLLLGWIYCWSKSTGAHSLSVQSMLEETCLIHGDWLLVHNRLPWYWQVQPAGSQLLLPLLLQVPQLSLYL